MDALKVLIVDDAPVTRRSLRTLLAVEGAIEVIGCADSFPQALAFVRRRPPDVMVLDIELRAGGRGVDLLRQVARELPRVRVVALTSAMRLDARRFLVDAGAAACFDKSMEFALARDWILHYREDPLRRFRL